MKKTRFVSLVIFVFLLLQAGASFSQPFPKSQGLEGLVRKHTHVNYSVEQDAKGNDVAKIFVKTVREYDREGNILMSDRYGVGEVLLEHFETTISKKEDGGKIIEFIFTNPEGKSWRGHVIVYDVAGRIVETLLYSELKGEFFGKTVMKYDEDGHTIEAASYGRDNSIQYLMKYRYDEEGRRIEWIDKSGVRGEFEYDERGNLISHSYYNDKGERQCQDLYRYDARGNRIEEIAKVMPDGSYSSKYCTTYDGKDRVVERSLYYGSGETLARIERYSYDEADRAVVREVYQPDGSISARIDSRYDEKNNLVEERRYDKSGNDDKLRLYIFVENDFSYWE